MTVRALPLLCTLGLAACVGTDFTGFGTERASFADDGARRVPAIERADLLAGNTLVGEGVTVFYAPDGTKLIRVDDGPTLERRWRVRDDGIMCEELTVAGAEVCADQGILYEKDGLFRAFHLDGSASPMSFVVVAGAPPEGLSSAELRARVGPSGETADPPG